MSDLVPGLSYDDFVAFASRTLKREVFCRSVLFRRHGAAIESLLQSPRIDAPLPREENTASEGSTGKVLRALSWNIEKGKRLDRLKRVLAKDAFLSSAHVYFLNEVDLGMARAGPNADVARELGRTLGCWTVFVPNYIECTLGLPGEVRGPERNERGLHGVAILSRFPVAEARSHALPDCWDYFAYREKKFGGRRGLYCLLDWGGRPLVVATAHIEMRTGPACRERQMRSFLEGLDRALADWGPKSPVVLAGDWNTHTFRRGSIQGAFLDFLRIIGTPPARLAGQLAWPLDREPLFIPLEQAGFLVGGLNEAATTARQDLSTVEDLALLPRFAGEAILKGFQLQNRVLEMRLDWIAARGLKPAAPPRTLEPGLKPEEPCSDHHPIAVDLVAEA